jgi:hypothetical protein
MAIDRIGKGGALPPTPETGGPAGASKAGGPAAPFAVNRNEHAAPANATRSVDTPDAASPLARLRAGEVDVNGYVDLKVDEATKGLKGVPAAELAEIKDVLRDQLRSDPGLADLVRAATGKSPSPPEE